MSKDIDRTGERFSRLLVLSRKDNNRYGGAMWLCKCDCGGSTITGTNNLISGGTKSCGCLNAETAKINGILSSTTHGMSYSPEYRSWASMKTRCYNKNHMHFKYYGGKGIRVCDKWMHSFAAFYADMGDKPASKHSIGRINNHGDYTPSNCRWETHTEQGENTRVNRFIEHNGEKMIVSQWAKKYNLPHGVLWNRVFYLGWATEEALTTPVNKRINNEV